MPVVQSLSCVRLFATPWTAARQATLSFSVSRSLLTFVSIESVMPSNHLILCRPLLLPPSIFPSIGSFPMSQLLTSVFSQHLRKASLAPLQIEQLSRGLSSRWVRNTCCDKRSGKAGACGGRWRQAQHHALSSHSWCKDSTLPGTKGSWQNPSPLHSLRPAVAIFAADCS